MSNITFIMLAISAFGAALVLALAIESILRAYVPADKLVIVGAGFTALTALVVGVTWPL